MYWCNCCGGSLWSCVRVVWATDDVDAFYGNGDDVLMLFSVEIWMVFIHKLSSLFPPWNLLQYARYVCGLFGAVLKWDKIRWILKDVMFGERNRTLAWSPYWMTNTIGEPLPRFSCCFRVCIRILGNLNVTQVRVEEFHRMRLARLRYKFGRGSLG